MALLAVYALGLLLALCLPPSLSQELSGTPKLVMWGPSCEPMPAFLPINADEGLYATAKFYADAIEQLSGKRPLILKEIPGQKYRGLYLGNTEYSRSIRTSFAPPVDERWATWGSLGNSIYMFGSDVATLQLAITREFWQLGYRHYSPEPGGIVYQPVEVNTVPRSQKTYIPQMQSRYVAGHWDTPAEKEWTRRLFARRHHYFSHNLFRVVRPEDFAEHPDWFPRHRGKFQKPRGSPNTSYQPNLDHPEVIERAANYVRDYFTKYPSARMVSLGMNDNLQLGGQAWESPRFDASQWYREQPDFSPYVFHFYNAVAEKVYVEFPDKHIGVLAYSWWQNYPGFKLHPMLFPYICEDRTLWHDPVRKAEGIELLRLFSEDGARPIGIYDYWYGDPRSYVIPRIHISLQAELFQLAIQYNVRGSHAEIFPNWGYDIAKTALAQEFALLAKGETPDVPALLDRIYDDLEKTGLANRERDEHYAKIWSQINARPAWLRFFKNPAQLRLAPALVSGDPAPNNTELTLISNYYKAQKSAAVNADSVNDFKDAAASVEPLKLPGFALVADPGMRWQQYQTISPGNFLKNPSLEAIAQPPEDDYLAAEVQWQHWYANRRPSEDLIILSSEQAAYHGENGLEIANASLASIAQTAGIVPGFEYRASVRVRGTVSGACSVYLRLLWLDASGNRIASSQASQLPAGKHADWQELVIIDKAPASAAFALLGLNIQYQNHGDYLHADLFKLEAVLLEDE